jgi:hypothetical protein
MAVPFVVLSIGNMICVMVFSGLNAKNDWYSLVKDAIKSMAKKEEKEEPRQIEVIAK